MRLLAIMLSSLLAFSVYAASLTDKDVQLWIKTIPSLQAWLDQHQDQLPEEDMHDPDFSMEAAFDRGIQQLREAGLYNQFNQQVKAAGFTSVEHWTQVSGKISMAYLALSMEAQPATRVEIQNQLQAIRSAKNIPAEEKSMLENMLNASLNMLDAVERVPVSEKNLVRPYLPQLADQFGYNEE